MLGSIATCTMVAVEVGTITYSLHKQGVFKDIRNSFKKRTVTEDVIQPVLKQIKLKRTHNV